MYSSEEIRQKHKALRQESPYIRSRDVAAILKLSEGELLASYVGDNVHRLKESPQGIIEQFVSLGEVMGLTRNEHCVHECHGVYRGAKFFQHGSRVQGLLNNPDIDLRLFLNHWRFCFAVTEEVRSGVRKSFQFFDSEGCAVHKVYLTERSCEEAFEKLVVNFRHPSQVRGIVTESGVRRARKVADKEIDWKGLRGAWENLSNTHDFFPLLKKFKVGRVQSFRRIGKDFAYPVDNQSAREVLQIAQNKECPLMVFVSNRGCLQIYSGFVKKLVEHGCWYNVLDSTFHLHLREEGIGQTWVTRKPTDDGIVTSLEVFDKEERLIIQFFGKRKPGIKELQSWRNIIEALPSLSTRAS